MPTAPTAWPIADLALSQQLLALLHQATSYKQTHKGANEVTKALNRADAALVVLAADTTPLDLLLHLPLLCEDKNVPYVYVTSKAELGRACGVGRPVIAACVVGRAGSDLEGGIERVREEVERLMV